MFVAALIVVIVGGTILGVIGYVDHRKEQKLKKVAERNSWTIDSFNEARVMLYHGSPAHEKWFVAQLEYKHAWSCTLTWECDRYRHLVIFSSSHNEASWVLTLKAEDPPQKVVRPGYGQGLRHMRVLPDDLLEFVGFTKPPEPETPSE